MMFAGATPSWDTPAAGPTTCPAPPTMTATESSSRARRRAAPLTSSNVDGFVYLT